MKDKQTTENGEKTGPNTGAEKKDDSDKAAKKDDRLVLIIAKIKKKLKAKQKCCVVCYVNTITHCAHVSRD